ncbi:Uncharacterised protein [uncultured archaeon]|nr:Uncharacterised protein [uncultured archaeon]
MTEGIALHWRLLPGRYNLKGTECGNCGAKFFPARRICSHCRRKGKIKDVKYSGLGEIYTYTIVRSPSTGFEFQKPFALAVIKLVEGPLVTAQVVDCDIRDVAIGKKVKAAFRKIIADGDEGIIRYGYKFRLVN